MRTGVFLLAICSCLACSLNYVQCRNGTNCRLIVRKEVNTYQITELYLMATGLMHQFQQNQMPHYSKFFDEVLMRHVRLMFQRLYGFAINEEQAIGWEAVAVRFLHLFIIRSTAFGAYAYHEYYLNSIHQNTAGPWVLQMICLTEVQAQTLQYLNNEFVYQNITEPVLLYELLHFTKLSILLIARSDPPYIMMLFRGNKYPKRFIDEASTSNAFTVRRTNSSIIYRGPIPFSPHENLLGEINAFYRAQASILNAIKPIENINITLDEFVDSNTLAYVQKFFDNWLKNCSSAEIIYLTLEKQQYIRKITIMLFFAEFLQGEYSWLKCHPLFVKDKAIKNMKVNMTRAQRIIKTFVEWLKNIIDEVENNSMFCNIVRALYNAITDINPLVGYSLRRTSGIAMVENREL